MARTTQPRHNFHLIIDQQLKTQLLSLPVFHDTTSFSGIVVRILQLMFPRLEKEHCFGRQRQSQYQLITDDPEAKRCSVHIYLPGELYRGLKLMHQDLNFYSIAQCLRWIIVLFLQLFNRYGL